jgi:hypothetical protein
LVPSGPTPAIQDVLERTRADNRRVSVERWDTEREYSHPRLLDRWDTNRLLE